jgi:diguanylate cyclase (GGDEF)-like protein
METRIDRGPGRGDRGTALARRDGAPSAGRRALGEALGARAEEVVARALSPDGSAIATERAHSLAAVRSFSSWMMTGEAPQVDAIEPLIDRGGERLANASTSVESTTRQCLAWRDAVILVLREEAERLGVTACVLDEAVSAARASCDAFTMRLGRRFDSERAKLKEILDKQNEELARQARRDPLTGIANRAQFFEQLVQAFGTSPRDRRSIAVLFVDLDGFKAVNDVYGHRVGDYVLKSAAQRLEKVIRPGDLVSRFGGDEFVVLCRNILDEDSTTVATKVAGRIGDAFTEPFPVDDHSTITLSASVGVAVGDHIVDCPEALVTAADAAMYLAKRRPSAEAGLRR